MNYADELKMVVNAVIAEGCAQGLIKVGQQDYKLDSVDDKDKAEFARKLKAQNDKIDNETPEERANRTAQFNKMIKGTAKKD